VKCFIDDHRQSGKVDFALHDCLMSALAMMFFQDPSLLSFQRRMQCNNLKTMFGVKNIPSDTVLRKTVDPIDTAKINSCFTVLFQSLQRGKQLEPYKLDSGHYLIALDGTQYFSSENISCPYCLTYKGSRKKMRYSRQILQAAMLNSNMRQVIWPAPELIIKSDGDTKNDCERSAGKRLIDKIRADHPRLKIMVTCDGLYSNQPFIDTLKDKGMSYILVAKSTDHSVLFEWVEELDGATDSVYQCYFSVQLELLGANIQFAEFVKLLYNIVKIRVNRAIFLFGRSLVALNSEESQEGAGRRS